MEILSKSGGFMYHLTLILFSWSTDGADRNMWTKYSEPRLYDNGENEN
jgi:hypothetical protein